MSEAGWIPPSTLEERLRRRLVPARAHLSWRVKKELRRGEPELRLLPFLVDRRRVALDIGANKGVWSWALRGLAREVHAFEPNPKIYAELEAALKGEVRLHPLALSDTEGTADFLVPRSSRGYSNQHGSLSAVRVPGEHGVVKVETRRLDALGIADVGFMKVDVEGFESAVLAGAAETLRRDRPTLIVELEERHTGRPIESLIEEIESYGYDGWALVDGCLTRWGEIDLQARHRDAAGKPGYIFNFVFLPRGR